MATTLGKALLEVAFDATSVEKGTKEVGDSVESKFSTIGKKLAGALAGAGIIAGAKKVGEALYGIGDTFDEVVDTIRVGTGATGDELDELVGIAKNVGTTVPTEFGKAAETVSDLAARMNIGGETLETVASQFLEAGRILGEDVNIDTATGALNAYNIAGEEIVPTMDALFRVSQSTNIGFNQLLASVEKQAPAMQELGFSIEETAGLIGLFDEAGLNSQAILAGMSRGMVTLAKDGEEPQAAFQRVIGEIEGFLEAGDRQKALALSGEMFGTKGASQFIGALESGTFSAEALTNVVAGTGDTILGVGEETQDFAEKWQIVKNKGMLALEPIAGALFDGIGGAITFLMPYVDQLTATFQTIQDIGLAQWFADAGIGVQVLGGVVGGVLVAALWLLVPVIWANVTAAWAWTAALLANPTTWIVLGIVALVAALVLLIANWDEVTAWIKNVWGGLVNWLAQTWENIKTAVAQFGTNIKTKFTEMWTNVKTTVSNGVTNVVTFFSSLPGKALNAVSSLLTSIKTWGSNVMSNAKDAITTGITNLITEVKTIPAKITNALSNIGSLLADKGRDLIQGFINGIKSMASNLINSIRETITDKLPGFVKDALGISSPSKVFAAIGRDTGLGFEQGLVDSLLHAGAEAESLLGRTMRGISGSASLSISGGSASGTLIASDSGLVAEVRQLRAEMKEHIRAQTEMMRRYGLDTANGVYDVRDRNANARSAVFAGR